jgi:hypothetical protein
LPTLSLWQYQRKYYFIILQTSQPCGAGLFPFSREGRNGKRHIAAVSRAADKAQTYPYSSSRKRLEIGGTQKIL